MYLVCQEAEGKERERYTLNICTVRKEIPHEYFWGVRSNVPFLIFNSFRSANMLTVVPDLHTEVQESDVIYGDSIWLGFEMLSSSRPQEAL